MEDSLFSALGAGRGAALSMRSTAVIDPADTTPPSASPGPVSTVVVSPAERSTRHKLAAAPRAIVSERVAVGSTAAPVVIPSSRKHHHVAASVTVSSASDLSERKKRPAVSEHRRRRHKSSRRSRSSSSTSSQSSVASRKKHRRHHKSKRAESPPPLVPTPKPSDTDCGRCGKQRTTDPLDPAIAGLSSKKKERIRQEIIRRIQRLKKNNPAENIQLPARGINDPVVCYRRYRRIARHLYAKRSIASYQLIVFVFTLIVQIAMSILFGPTAAEYLKKEYEQIHKYDGVFYEMGCRAYSPYSVPQSPEYRFAWQLVSPILIIGVAYFIGRYTPVPPVAINIFSSMAAEYLKTEHVIEYRTLLHDDDDDEPDDDDDSESSDDEEKTHRHRESGGGPRIDIPDLEADLPSDNIGTAAIQAAVPGLVNMITSLRAQAPPVSSSGTPVATADPMSGMVGTLMNLAQTFMAGPSSKPQPSAVPPPSRAAASRSMTEPVIYNE